MEKPTLEQNTSIKDVLKANGFVLVPGREIPPIVENDEAKRIRSLSPQAGKAVESLLAWSQRYLKGPQIHDKFGLDHNARRAKEKDLEKLYGAGVADAFANNRLGFNNLNTLYPTLEWMTSALKEIGEEDDIVQELRKIYREFPDQLKTMEAYRDTPPEQKVALGGFLESLATRILSLFSNVA